MKIVLDTNVFVSALFWHGPPNKLLRLAEDKIFTLCITSGLLKELRDVLNRPSFSSRLEDHKISCEEVLAGIIDIAELHPDKKIDPIVKEDPDDDAVLSCALTAGAKYIITGDSHLLNLKKRSGISILTPRQSLRHIK